MSFAFLHDMEEAPPAAKAPEPSAVPAQEQMIYDDSEMAARLQALERELLMLRERPSKDVEEERSPRWMLGVVGLAALLLLGILCLTRWMPAQFRMPVMQAPPMAPMAPAGSVPPPLYFSGGVPTTFMR
jgi:hypothetical protein